MVAKRVRPVLVFGAALIVILAVVCCTIAFSNNSTVDASKLSSGNMGYMSFGGTVVDVDREAKKISVALKWEMHSDQECDKTVTCDYGGTTNKDSLEVIEGLAVGNEVRGSSWTKDYYEKDPVPLGYICLEDGSRGEQWIATEDRYPADPSYDERGFKRGELESLGIVAQ